MAAIVKHTRRDAQPTATAATPSGANCATMSRRASMKTKTEETGTRVRASKLDGARVAAEIKREVAEEVERLKRERGVVPRLATVLVGDDAASAVYVRNKIRTCEELGIASEHRHLPAETTSAHLLEIIDGFNRREDVHGILVQLPLP